MATKQVGAGWKYATVALSALLVAQFAWWNKKAPNVLGAKKGY